MAVNIHITIIELNALHTKRQNLFQELDAVIHLLMEAKHWGLRKSRNATSLNSRFKSLDTLKVKIISVTFRRVIRTNHKKASKIWRLKFNLTIPLQQLNGLETLVIIKVANKYAFLQITRRRLLNEWEAFKKVISRRNIPRRLTMPLPLSNLNLLRRITRTENILHRNFTRRQVAIQNRVASNIGISQSTFSVKVLNLFSRSRRKTNKRKSKHSAMLRNKETRHRMFIGLLNTTRKLA